MPEKRRDLRWFYVPALAAGGLMAASCVPGFEGAKEAAGVDSLSVPIAAAIVLSLGVGAVVGLVGYALHRALTPRRVSPRE